MSSGATHVKEFRSQHLYDLNLCCDFKSTFTEYKLLCICLQVFLPCVQERDLWGTLQEHDSSIYTENGFEMLVDVDGSMFNYKQVDV